LAARDDENRRRNGKAHENGPSKNERKRHGTHMRYGVKPWLFRTSDPSGEDKEIIDAKFEQIALNASNHFSVQIEHKISRWGAKYSGVHVFHAKGVEDK
jgi:hypothetical protein